MTPSDRWSGWLDREDVFILDSETTGLGRGAEVLEVAVLDTIGAVRFEALSIPVGRISGEAAAIHGLTRKRLKAEGARPWPEVHAELVAALDGASAVLAWNAGFDRRLLAQTAEHHGLGLPAWPWHDLLADWRAITRHKARVGGSLAAAVKHTGAKVGPAHRAASDSRAALAVMRAVAAKRKHLA